MSVTLDLMQDPLNLQKYVLDSIIDKIENTTGHTDLTLVDPNSVFLHLVEAYTNTTAQLAKNVQDEFDRRNPLRAQTDADLYLHMSDFDYIGSYATPSKVTINLTIDKNYVLQKGVQINENYKVLIIPRDTIISIGTLQFSLYYPIRIQVDIRTNIPLVTYDIEEQNPLFPLKSNRVVFSEQKYLTYDFLSMSITAYQFTKVIITDTIQSEIGYAKYFDYANKFYAIRLFSIKDGKYTELKQSLIQDNYDPYTPTARVEVDTNKSRVIVNIPMIYFTNGLMGNKLEAHLYTTQGNISINVGSAPVDQCKINFNINDKNATDYNRPLMQIPMVYMNVVSTTTEGGTDGYTFEEKRIRVVNDSFNANLLVTPQDLENHFGTYGIKVLKYYDNLTNLIYFAYHPLKDNTGTIIPTANTYLEVKPNDYTEVSTIKRNVDTSMTILPKTMWYYETGSNLCKPVKDIELEVLAEKTKEDIIDFFNNNTYVRTPFHIRLETSPTYPKATSYNLMNPYIEEVTITGENVEVSSQMLMIGEAITHENEGAEGYKIRLIVKKDIMDDVPEEDIVVWIYCYDSDNVRVGTVAKYIEDIDNHAIYEFKLDTDYYIDSKSNINITSLTDDTTEWDHKLAMETEFHVVFMAKTQYFPGVYTLPSLFEGVPNKRQQDMTVLLRQSFVVNLGHALDNVYYNNINITKSAIAYKKYEVDVPMRYPHDVYQLDTEGDVIVDTSSGDVTIRKLHSQGDIMTDAEGKTMYQYRKGDYILDSGGNKIVTDDRVQLFQIMAPIIDAKMYISENITQKAFVTSVTKDFENYFKIIKETSGSLSERTKIYFRPSTTMGVTKYNVGDSVTIQAPLDLSFKFRLMVTDGVITDAKVKSAIEESTISIVEEYLTKDIISQTEITETIRDDISYVVSVDTLGINGAQDMQTLIPIDNSVRPTIKQELYLTSDEEINIRKKVDIEYVSRS